MDKDQVIISQSRRANTHLELKHLVQTRNDATQGRNRSTSASECIASVAGARINLTTKPAGATVLMGNIGLTTKS